MKCRVCETDKPPAEFVQRSDRKKPKTICKSCHAKKERIRRKSTGNRYHRNYLLLVKYGLTLENYDEMVVLQNGMCAICGTKKPGGRWARFHVDHDHDSGEVRALLCNKCNQGLGLFQDNPRLLKSAARYIESFQKDT